MAQETRNAYGEKLAELIKQNIDVVVLDADLTKSTKTNLSCFFIASEIESNCFLLEVNNTLLFFSTYLSYLRVITSPFLASKTLLLLII